MNYQTKHLAFDDENRLLLLLLLKNLPDKTLLDIKSALQKPLNWDYFISMANRHRVTPIVFGAMKQLRLLESVPETVRLQLRQSYLASMARSMAYQEELASIMQRLESVGVPILVLKGAALAEGLYDDSGIRPSNDLDILVSRESIETTHRMMTDLGYVLTEEYRPLDFYERHHFHFVYLKENDVMDYVIEVHWDLFPRAKPVHFDLDTIWSNKIALSLNGLTIHTLNWDDYFLYLCTNCVREGFKELIFFSDLIRITHKISERDWESIGDKTRQWNTESAVAGCTKILKDIFNITTPDALRKNMNRRQSYFINAIGSERNIVQQFLQSEWTVKTLAEFLFLKQDTMKLIGRYLTPTEIDFYKTNYALPGHISFYKRTVLVLKGLKALVHLAWTFIRLFVRGMAASVMQQRTSLF